MLRGKPGGSGGSVEPTVLTRPVEDAARERLAETHYARLFQQITVHYSDGVLTLRGRLPSFYLKQVLQTLLLDLEGVTRIDNRVEVANAAPLVERPNGNGVFAGLTRIRNARELLSDRATPLAKRLLDAGVEFLSATRFEDEWPAESAGRRTASSFGSCQPATSLRPYAPWTKTLWMRPPKNSGCSPRRPANWLLPLTRRASIERLRFSLFSLREMPNRSCGDARVRVQAPAQFHAGGPIHPVPAAAAALFRRRLDRAELPCPRRWFCWSACRLLWRRRKPRQEPQPAARDRGGLEGPVGRRAAGPPAGGVRLHRPSGRDGGERPVADRAGEKHV